MMTYFEKLNVYVPDVVEAGAPILINEVALIKDTVDDEILLRITMANSVEKAVIAVAVKIQMWDVFGDEVSADGVPYKEYVYQDISFAPLSIYGNTVPIRLPDSVRRVNVVITRVVFSDGTVWKSNSDNYVHVQQQELLEGTDDFLETLRSDGEKYPPILAFVENEECWQCTCGGVNKKGTEKCYRCGRKKDFCFKAYSADVIHDEFAAFVEEKKSIAEQKRKIEEERKKAEEERRRIREAEDAEKHRIEKERIAEQWRVDKEKRRIKEEEERKRKKKERKRIIISFVAIAAVIVGVTAYIKLINPMIKFSKAQKLYEDGNYKDAEKLFSELGEYKDSNNRAIMVNREIIYQNAESEYQDRNFSAAYEHFDTLLGERYQLPDEYGTSFKERVEEKRDKALYDLAKSHMDDKNYYQAVQAYKNLGDYEDSADLLKEAIYQYSLQLIDKKQYKDAMPYLQSIEAYKNTIELFQKCVGTTIEEGSIIEFGKYESDGNGTNGKEPIKWRVLDKHDDHILISTCMPLEYMEYGNTETFSWEQSLVRKWLNSDFYQESFTDYDRERIIMTKVKTKTNDGKIEKTKDYIYIPSKRTIEKYASKKNWEWNTRDNKYLCDNSPGTTCFPSWVRNYSRTSTEDYYNIMVINPQGQVAETGGVSPKKVETVRPMMWIDCGIIGNDIADYGIIISEIETETNNKENDNILSSSSSSSTTNLRSSPLSNSISSNSNSGGYGYDPSDPYYSAADHDGDGKLTDDEFQEAMGNAIDDIAAQMGIE